MFAKIIAKTGTKADALQLLLCLFLVPAGPALHADSLAHAQRLLRVSNTEAHFQYTADRQTQNIIRTYSSIVAMSVDVNLPRRVTNSIASCYTEVFAWENFELGIARILADQLSEKELLILIDFYDNLGLPPMEIETFKATIAKGPQIAEISADYIYANTESCVDKDAALIRSYLTSRAVRPDISLDTSSP